MSTRLNNDATNTDDRLCFGFTEDAIKLAIGADVKAKITERDDKSYATQVYYSMALVLLEWKKLKFSSTL